MSIEAERVITRNVDKDIRCHYSFVRIFLVVDKSKKTSNHLPSNSSVKTDNNNNNICNDI